jgi:hypothetical protein
VRSEANKAAKDVLESMGASPAQIQQKIADFNLKFKSVGTPAEESQVYGTASELLLDSVEDSLGNAGDQYRLLRQAYGAVRGSLKYLNAAAKRTTNAPKFGKNLITGEDIVFAVASPQAALANIGRKLAIGALSLKSAPDKILQSGFKTLSNPKTTSPIVSSMAKATSGLSQTPAAQAILKAGGATVGNLIQSVPKNMLGQ